MSDVVEVAMNGESWALYPPGDAPPVGERITLWGWPYRVAEHWQPTPGNLIRARLITAIPSDSNVGLSDEVLHQAVEAWTPPAP